jgi:hypothetical protein
MREKNSEERTIEGTEELLAALPGQHEMWALTDDSRRWSRALLGPPPPEPTNRIPAPAPNPLAERPSDLETPSEADDSSETTIKPEN